MPSPARLVAFACLTLIVFLAASAAAAQAVGSVHGRVLDETGAAIPNATIRLVNALGSYQRIARSDAVGEFVLLNLPPDTYQLIVRAEGFAPAERTLTLQPGAALELEVTLKVAAVIAETVVVTGTRTEHLQVDAPVRTTLLTPQVIEHKEAVTLAEALTTTTGVRVESKCQNCNFTEVRLNGLEGWYTQILENGLPTFNNLSMVYGLEQIPTAMIERIEVVKGGASALYGANAVAGVINIIPRESLQHRIQVENKHGWHRGRPLNHVGVNGSIFSPKANSPWAGTYFFNGIRAVAVDRDNDGFTDIGKRKGLSGGATLHRALLAEGGKLTLGGTVISEFRRGGDQLDRPPEETWVTEQADVRRYNGFFRWNHTLSPRTVYILAGSYVFLRRNSYYGSGMDPNAYGFTRNPLFTSDFLFSHQQSKHTLTTGLQFQRDHIRDSAPAYNRLWDQTFRNLGFYIQDEYQPVSWLILVGGLRLDKHSNLADPVLSPRANLRLRLAENWNLRAGITTGFRAPVIFDEDFHITQVGGEGFVIENSPDLKEERSLSYTLALDYVRQIRNLPFQLGVNLYYTGLEDVHVLEEVPVPGNTYRHYLRVNRKGSYLRGFELDLDWRLTTALWLRAGAAFESARYREPEPDFGSLKYFRTPGAYGFLSLLANLPRGWDLYTDFDFTGRMWVPHYAGFIPEDRLERTKPFQVWNLKVSKKFRNPCSDAGEVKLFFGVDNLLDDYQPDLDQGRLRDAGYVYGPGRMRSFYTGLRVSF